METREMLEDQVSSCRKRAEKVPELESQMMNYEKLLNDMLLERAADKDKYQEIIEENAQLQRSIKTIATEMPSSSLLLNKRFASDSEDGALPDGIKNSGHNAL